MDNSLKSLSFLLALFFVELVSAADNSGESTNFDPSDGPLWILKNPNVVFYLDSENIPNTISIGYVEDVLVESLEEFNNIENTTLSLSYGGVIDGACENVYTGLPDVQPDPDRDVLCFVDNVPSAGASTVRTFSDDGILHERSFVVINPDRDRVDDFQELKYVVLHEVGHVAGMGHVPQDIIDESGYDGSSVMCNSQCSSSTSTLYPYDIAQLQAFYPTEYEKYPEYPMYCAKKVGGRPFNVHPDDVDPGDYYFDHLMFKGRAFEIKTNFNPELGRFDVLSLKKQPLQTDRDCTGLELELDNLEIFLPYIIYERSILQLLLKVRGNGVDIIDQCQIYPETDEVCSIDP